MAVFFDPDQNQAPAGVVARLQASGFDARLSGRRRVRFQSLEATGGQTPGCYRHHGWAAQNAVNAMVVQPLRAAAAPPTPVVTIDINNVNVTGAVRDRLQAAQNLGFFAIVEELLVSSPSRLASQIVDLLVAPEFFRQWPNGRIAFVDTDPVWADRAGTLRALAATDTMSWNWLRPGAGAGQFRGFPMLRGYHSGPTVNFDTLLAAYFAVAAPQIELLCVPRNPGWLLFVLDQPCSATRAPKSAWEVVAGAYDTVAAAGAGGGRRSIIRTPLGVGAVCTLADGAIERFNACYTALTAPESFRFSNGRCDFAAMATALAEFDRVTIEVGTAGTTPSHFTRKLRAFAVADKVAAAGFRAALAHRRARLAALPLSAAQRRRRLARFKRGLEPRLFSGLLTSPALCQRFVDTLLASGDALDATLAATLPLLQGALSNSVLAGIYPPGARAAGRVHLRFRNRRRGKALRTEHISEEAYVRSFLREMRNTHHGYGLFDDKFERLLACHTGQFGDEGADIALVLWHAILACPDLLVRGQWVQGLRLGRYRLL